MPIGGIEEARQPVVATLNDMLRDAGQIEGGMLRHNPASLPTTSPSTSAPLVMNQNLPQRRIEKCS
jgi:hypothetical protein